MLVPALTKEKDMSRLNQAVEPIYTHEGAKAKHINPLMELRRTLLSCMLWEKTFYEDGVSVADRIRALAKPLKKEDVAALAIEARTKYKLRHAPLLLARELARNHNGKVVGKTIADVIRRADELTEFLAMYWQDGKTPLSKQVKLGLANAFRKFNAYRLAKYNRDNVIKLRDVLFLCHAKPKDAEQEQTWKKLIDGTLEAPDTWEVALSGGGDKKESFERLLKENKLGYMALLRNLRNMADSGVDESLVFGALQEGARGSKALPFRFIAAARSVPRWEPQIDQAMQLALNGIENLPGKTVLLIDHSGSMNSSMSSKSDLNRFDAACALAILANGISASCRVFVFANDFAEVAPRNGMALADAIMNSMAWGGTWLGKAVSKVDALAEYDRLIVFTDEQSHDVVPNPKGKGYMINVASYKNGIGYGAWTHIDGFSEAVIDFVREYEKTT